MSRIILVTGGTGALGSAVTEKFLLNGDTVIVTDIREATESFNNKFLAYSGKLHFYKVDVTSETEIQDLAAEIREKFSGIEVLVNVVGGFDMSKIENTSLESLDKMLDMNLKSAFICSKNFIYQLKEKENGRIINISARAGLKGAGGMGPYSISKAGVISLTEAMADELKDTGVTVNAVMPSIIDTEMNRKDMPGADFSKWVAPADLANVIFFLASTEARAINGASIPVYHKA